MSSRKMAQSWPIPRYNVYQRQMRQTAQQWFDHKSLPRDPRYPFILDSWDNWPRNLILRPGGNDLIETAPLSDLPPRPSEADIAARAAECQACPDYQPGPDRCQRCGCGFVVAERTRSRFARCPAGRWPQ